MVFSPYPSTRSYAALFHQQLGVPNSCTSTTAIQPQAASSMEGVISIIDEGNGMINSGSLVDTSPTTREQRRQIVSRIGAAGRRLADAVKGVKRDGNKSSL